MGSVHTPLMPGVLASARPRKQEPTRGRVQSCMAVGQANAASDFESQSQLRGLMLCCDGVRVEKSAAALRYSMDRHLLLTAAAVATRCILACNSKSQQHAAAESAAEVHVHGRKYLHEHVYFYAQCCHRPGLLCPSPTHIGTNHGARHRQPACYPFEDSSSASARCLQCSVIAGRLALPEGPSWALGRVASGPVETTDVM